MDRNLYFAIMFCVWGISSMLGMAIAYYKHTGLTILYSILASICVGFAVFAFRRYRRRTPPR